jgi:hypothetical protein
MLARRTLTKQLGGKEPPRPGQSKPQEERFLLRVDGQTKRSFSSLDDATAAGRQIKKAYPVVVVTVIDATDGSSNAITA